MKVKLRIRHKQGWFRNVDFAVEEISAQPIQMPGGFKFYLPNLSRFNYPGKDKGGFDHPKELTFEFTIPVGRVRLQYSDRTPRFDEQKTNFVVLLSHRGHGKIEPQAYEVSVCTDIEIQSL
jgi:hypothetical protein